VDPITTAILAALGAGAAKSAGEAGGKAIVDAYKKLKHLLKTKFGNESGVAKAVEELEANPDSVGRKEVLKEEVAAVKADQDENLRRAAQQLLDQIGSQPGGERHIQQVIGSTGVAQADRGSTATVNYGNRSKD